MGWRWIGSERMSLRRFDDEVGAYVVKGCVVYIYLLVFCFVFYCFFCVICLFMHQGSCYVSFSFFFNSVLFPFCSIV